MSRTAGAAGPPVEARDGQQVGGGGVVARYANFVRLPHTLFALPFALVGVTLGTWQVDLTLRVVGWVVVAFTAARFAAMGFNRIADREFDARNPRTAGRELPAGTMSSAEAAIAVAVAAAVFLFAAWQLNPLCFALSPLALAWTFFYSYTKRFTRWSHLVLGLGLGIAPVGGFLAVAGAWSDPWWMLPVLALAVTCWVAGFDIIYAMADLDVDRREGLHSVPAAFGPVGALRISAVLHLLAVVALVTVASAIHAGVWYHIGVGVAAALLLVEQVLAARGRTQAAFFTVNMALSSVFLAFVVLERTMPFRPLS